MAYLEGNHIQTDLKTLRNHIGRRIKYLLERDIDKTGRGFFFPRVGVISEIYRNQVDLTGHQDFINPKSIREIVLLD